MRGFEPRTPSLRVNSRALAGFAAEWREVADVQGTRHLEVTIRRSLPSAVIRAFGHGLGTAGRESETGTGSWRAHSRVGHAPPSGHVRMSH